MNELKQMEALKEFDKMNKKYNSYTILGYKVVGILFGIIGFSLAMIPIQEWDIWDIRMLVIFFMYFFIIHFMYYECWQVVGAEKQRLSIYQMLKEVPISPNVIRRDRAKKMFAFSVKVTLAFMGIQIASSVIFLHELCIWNIAFPLLCGICAYGMCYLLVKTSIMC